jgi:protein PET100
VQFGLYLSFPIGYMYYFGTNLESRFSVPDFWPTQEQSHKIPYEKEEIRAEIERHQRAVKERRDAERREQLERAKMAFAQGRGGEGDGEGVKETVA